MIWEIEHETRVVDGLDAQGRPDPAYAAALGLVPAPFGRRALAFAIDIAIWLILQLPLWLGAVPLLLKLATGAISPYGFVNHPDFVLAVIMAAVSVALSLVYVVVQWMLHGLKGITIGKAITGIRSVNVMTLERPGVWAVLLRYIIVAASGILPAVGPALVLLSPTFDLERRGRGWHDRIGKVWLVDVRHGLNPYDEKRMRVARKTVKAEPAPERVELPSLATPRDPVAQPEYRPGSRISAGVVGVPRSPEAPAMPAPAAAAAPASAPVNPATPSPAATPAAPAVATPAPAVATSAPAVATSAPAVAVSEAPGPRRRGRMGGLALRLDTGETIPVTAPILLGRDPDAAAHPGARAVPLTDTTRTLSKTHALVQPVAGGLEIIDLRSTNGCGVIRGGIETELASGGSATVAEGDAIRLGDRTADVVQIAPLQT
ncbi:RDD family protein [Microbacterium aurum]|uniref:RDD family protein n=1 Tax=Microbacterium aurum TaxID=36805 RepID=UPI001EF3FE9B|nr:RDD family protein [Microbacterium aurum]MCG7413547.1 RDD family protein [Microbacterium aurum]